MFAKKIVLGLSASVAVMAQDINRNTLEAMLDFYNGAWTVSTNYWVDYGCNCRSDLDRTANGQGRAVDELDQTCKTWKQCMKCSGCDDVNTAKYVARKRRGQYYCKDEANTCERALCECDIQFAKTSGAIGNTWSKDNWAQKGFDSSTCEKQQGGNFDGQCCFDDNYLAQWYNANKMCCQSDGAILPIGTCL